jgi:hypothetical protein
LAIILRQERARLFAERAAAVMKQSRGHNQAPSRTRALNPSASQAKQEISSFNFTASAVR